MTRLTFLLMLLTGILLVAAAAFTFPSPDSLHARQVTQTPMPSEMPQTGCAPQGEIVTRPITDNARMCPQYLVSELPVSALPGITSLAYAPACTGSAEQPVWCGRLFFVRPDIGAVEWIGPFDPNTAAFPRHTFATGLATPNGLAWHQDSLYVAGAARIYRLQDTNGDGEADSTVILTDSLPAGPGVWAGSIAIGPDERIYVSTGASCGACEDPDPRRAALLSFALDGTDARIEANGLAATFDFAWQPETGILFAADSERDGLGPLAPLDEINRIEAGQHYGWPYCYETETGTVSAQSLTPPADFCQSTRAPFMTLPAHSAPAGMVFYNGQAFPEFEGDLLVVLAGESDGRLPHGYALYRVCLGIDGELEACQGSSSEPTMDSAGNELSAEVILPVDSYYGYGLDIMTLQGQGFYPEHPIDIAISPSGTIAISLAEGRIIELLPAILPGNKP